MGDQFTCRVRCGEDESGGTAHLESGELVFRGAFRLAIPFAEVTSAAVVTTQRGDELVLASSSGTVTVSGLGAGARRWAEAIRNPKPVIDKLGVKPGMRVALVDVEDDAFATQVGQRASGVTRAAPRASSPAWDLIFFQATRRSQLRRIPAMAGRLKPNGALWVLRPKGSPDLGEQEVLEAGRAAGLVDTKVVAYSPALSATKFVIPVGRRQPA